MKKQFFLLLGLFISIGLCAQKSVFVADRAEIKDSIKIGNKWYKRIPDSVQAGNPDSSIYQTTYRVDTAKANINQNLASRQANYGGAPGQLQGTYAGIPAATGYPTGTTYIAQDIGQQFVDTGSGASRGWKNITGSGGTGSTNLGNSRNATSITLTSSSGTSTTVQAADTATAGMADTATWLYTRHPPIHNLNDWNAPGYDSSFGTTLRAAHFVKSNKQALYTQSSRYLTAGYHPFTIACWAKFDSLSSSQNEVILAKDNDSTNAGSEYLLGYVPFYHDSLVFQVQTRGNIETDVVRSSLGIPVAGNWYFIICSYDTVGKIKLEVTDIASGVSFVDSLTGIPHFTNVTTTGFTIGGLSNSGPNGLILPSNNTSWMSGSVKSVGFWNRLLTTAEKTTLYNASGKHSGMNYGTLSGGWTTSIPAALSQNMSATTYSSAADVTTFKPVNIPATGGALSFWFNASSFGGIPFSYTGSGNTYIYLVNSTTIRVQTDVSSTMASFTVPTMNAGIWYNLIISRDGTGNTHCYLNGTESSTGGVSQPSNPMHLDQIGQYWNNTAGLNYEGSIAEVQIFQSALTNTDISLLSAGYSAVTVPGLYYRMNEGSGTQVVDYGILTGPTPLEWRQLPAEMQNEPRQIFAAYWDLNEISGKRLDRNPRESLPLTYRNQFLMTGLDGKLNFLAPGKIGYIPMQTPTGIMWQPNPTSSSYTFLNGLTNSAGTVTNDLVTGKIGGGTATGGTGSGNALNLQSTTHATKGRINFGIAGNNYFDESIGNMSLGSSAASTSMLKLTASNLDGGATLFPFLGLYNTNTTQATSGSQYNISGITMSAGNGSVLGQLGVTYTNSGSSAPWNDQGMVIASAYDPIGLWTNGNQRMHINSNGHVAIASDAIGMDNGTAQFQVLATVNQLALHYDPNNYATANVGATGVLTIAPTGITTKFAASTTAGATLNIPAGAAPASPNDGDIYNDATSHLAYIYLNGAWVALGGGASAASWTPTLTNSVNISSSTLLGARYTISGNMVHCRVSLQITPTSASTLTHMTISLPFTPASGQEQPLGICSVSSSPYAAGIVYLGGTSSAFAEFTSVSASSSFLVYEFDYSL